MTDHTQIVEDTWRRYVYLRDEGHLNYVHKARKCENFFEGLQWEASDLALLKASKRPALTINKIISTLSNVMGEQIFNRTETAFRPRRSGATSEIADVLTQVFMQISDNNQLPWVRSDVFADGVITSRGFFDARLDFTDSLQGEVRITQLNPKNVLIDADADEYDPDKWSDVVISKWLTVDSVALLYGKNFAEKLRGVDAQYSPYAFDSVDWERDRFGNAKSMADTSEASKSVRVIERQYKKMTRVEYFVDIERGDMREIPGEWDHDRISMHLTQNPHLTVVKRLGHKIRWCVVADKHVLHDDWSPYKHFTVVPYFPYFRRGRTVGLVENLLGPQELLNKVSSQELHVINTTANSGWKLKRNALTNMSIAELEQRGAQTGLVLELDEIASAEKITPNQIPSGLDRVSYKAEEHIKTISGVSDYQQGFAREDVSAKAVKMNQTAGSANFAKVMDNLNRTDFLLARNVLDMVQSYYTEPRLMFITTDRLTNDTSQLEVNQISPEGGILNDLTLGEYTIVITNQPERDTFEDTQFEHAVALRKDVGVAIDDKYIIKASRLKDKADIIRDMEAAGQSPEAQEDALLNREAKKAEVAKLQGEAAHKHADAQVKLRDAQQPLEDQQLEWRKMEMEMEMERVKMENDIMLQREKLAAEMEMKRIEMQMKLQIMKEESVARQQQMRADAAMKAKQAESQPQTKEPVQ